MGTAERSVHLKGARILTVKTQVANRSAVSFYLSWGFAPSSSPRTTYHIWLTHKILPCVRYNVPYITGDEVSALSHVVKANAMDCLGSHSVACKRWREATLSAPRHS